MKQVTRGTDEYLIGFSEDGKLLHAKKNDFFKKRNIDCVIRLQKEDFVHLDSVKAYLVRFNLQRVNFKVGERIALVLIVKPGYFNGKKEVLPVLSLKNAVVADCVDVRNNVSYDELTEENFKYSLEHIKSVPELKKAILRRYKKSMPGLSDKQMLALGVSVTKLKIVDRKDLLS